MPGMGMALPLAAIGVAMASAVGHALYGAQSATTLLVVYGWSSVWVAVGYVAHRLRSHPTLGTSMMLFGIGELVTAAGASYVGSGAPFTILRGVAVAINAVQLAWLGHLAMMLLRLRATRRIARLRALVIWSYGIVYATALLITSDPTVLRGLAAGWVLMFAGLVAWMAVRWLRSPARLRRVRAIPTIVAVLTVPLLLVAAVDAARRGTPVWTGSLAVAGAGPGPPHVAAIATFWLSLAVIPGSYLFGVLRQRIALGQVADLVSQLGTLAVAELEPALAAALGDSQLRLLIEAPPHQPVPRGRVVSDVAQGVQLVHDPSLLDEKRLLDAVRRIVALALEREGLEAAVADSAGQARASQARIIEAADSARRRLERDLHDGAQQRLLAVGLVLQEAEATLPPSARQVLAGAHAELQAALSELRDLARGIHPQVLTDRGLPGALHQLARHAALPVRVAAEGVGRLSAQVEAAAYFVVAEALTNAAKYAHASAVEVTVHCEPGWLTVTVIDDGVGGADPAGGSGLTGLRDRLATLEGRLDLDSPTGGGTRLVAHIPVPSAAGSELDERS